ncbi:MAG: AsnC family transcriptional regulator [Nitrososphaerota archaeon]|nr:AsnC family transcriptional regulator [Nitrososphaerota archaeon]
MKLDEKDTAILEVLLKDGRASLREVAARTSLTAPTVSMRLARMRRGGLIRGFAPVLDPSASPQVAAFVRLRVPAEKAGAASEALARLPEVEGVYMTAGEGNLLVRLGVDDLAEVETFVEDRLSAPSGWRVVSSDVVTKSIKDASRVRVPRAASLKFRCDYCHQEVRSDRPHSIRVGQTSHYFCCSTCRKSYASKHGGELAAARAKLRRTALHP